MDHLSTLKRAAEAVLRSARVDLKLGKPWPKKSQVPTRSIKSLMDAVNQINASGCPTRSVLDEIIAERRRQIEVEGYDEMHDDEHRPGEIASAAAAIAMNVGCVLSGWNGYPKGHSPDLFPWDEVYWKPKGPRRDLIIAMALLWAEIDRIDRAIASKPHAKIAKRL